MYDKIFGALVAAKAREAAQLINGSVGEKGFFAGSGERYLNQYWTRDFALALAGSVEAIKFLNVEPERGQLIEAIRRHLVSLQARQGKDGAIPILFADFPDLFVRKMQRSGQFNIATKTLTAGNSFVLSRIFDGMYCESAQYPEFADFEDPCFRAERGLYRLTPGTTDSELMFAFAALTFGPLFQEPVRTLTYNAARRAVQYMEERHVRDGLMVGADWRDTMEVFFADKHLLSNNVIRYMVHKLLNSGKQEQIAKRIEDVFWNGADYIDYPGATRFDPLGASLAVLAGLVPHQRYCSVMHSLKSVDTDWGVTIQCRHNPYKEGEAEVIERTDGVVVWPFVCGFAGLALFEMGYSIFALNQLAKMTKQKGFGEYYDPLDGSQWGESHQGWSAALYLLLCKEAAMHPDGIDISQFRTE